MKSTIQPLFSAVVLNATNLAKLRTLLLEAASHWFDLGLNLGVDLHVLERIEKDHSTVNRQFTAMLVEWLNSLDVSWERLLEALIQPPIQLHSLALKISREQGVYLLGE